MPCNSVATVKVNLEIPLTTAEFQAFAKAVGAKEIGVNVVTVKEAWSQEEVYLEYRRSNCRYGAFVNVMTGTVEVSGGYASDNQREAEIIKKILFQAGAFKILSILKQGGASVAGVAPTTTETGNWVVARISL